MRSAPAPNERATVYVSDEAHSSVQRALRVLGVAPEHVRVLPSDRCQRLVPAVVAAAVAGDRAAGRLPICLVATAGTTGPQVAVPAVRGELPARARRRGASAHVPHGARVPARGRPGAEEVNFAGRGIQLTRQFRALKLWMSLKVLGVAAFRAAIEHGIALAEHAEAVLADHPAWEVVTPAQLGIVTFRPATGLAAGLPDAALADGFA